MISNTAERLRPPPPIFLLASERSGTNLLRKLITMHQRIYFGPSPAHFLKHLFHAAPYYGELANDSNFSDLVRDAISLCDVHFSPWIIRQSENDLIKAYDQEHDERDIILLSDMMMRRYAESQGFSGYFCKDNDLYDYAYQILTKLPNAKFIYLHRDPRDFAVSQMNRTLQSNNLYSIAQLWRQQQTQCISVTRSMPDRVFRLSYESLIADQEACLRSICEFLETDYLDSAQDVHVHSGNAKEWSNLSSPVMKDNSGKFRSRFSQRQISMIEDVCWNQMRWLGYQPSTRERVPTSKARIALEYALGDALPVAKRRLLGVDERDAWSIERRKTLKKIRSRYE